MAIPSFRQAVSGPAREERLGEHGGERMCQKAVRDMEKRNWGDSDIWVVAPFLCCPPELDGPDIM